MLSSDKTNISALVGDRCAHPLLLGLANIHMSTRLKLSSDAFLLVALLPIPKFLHKSKRMCGMLTDRLIHECLDITLEPLKQAARLGIMMNDPLGNLRLCYTPLASYVVDTPEACMLAAVGGKTSPVTTAMYKHFGDNFRHPPRTKMFTLQQLQNIDVDPDDLERYFKAAQEYHLNGVSRPFFRNWAFSDPSHFFNPEILHHWHKFVWDHDVKWAINIVGAAELDFRFSVLQPSVGYRHFGEGISHLTKVTGRTQRDVQRYLIAAIAGAAPPSVVLAMRLLMDFCYLAQSRQLDSNDCATLLDSLERFHTNKASIIKAGGRKGKQKVIDNWYIPKLELLQSVIPSICASGALAQWTADVTEHAHVVVIKNPARRSNNIDIDPQICRHLDRVEKCSKFELATSLRELQNFAPIPIDSEHYQNEDLEAPTTTDVDDELRLFQSVVKLGQPKRSPTNYFKKAQELMASPRESVLFPLCTFVVCNTAISAARDPKVFRATVDDISISFDIPDLHDALGDYFQHEAQRLPHQVTGQHRLKNNCSLPFSHLAIWHAVRLQQMPFHPDGDLNPAQTVVAAPPSAAWQYGQYDSVLVNIDSRKEWPQSGLDGKSISHIQFPSINSSDLFPSPRPLHWRGTAYFSPRTASWSKASLG